MMANMTKTYQTVLTLFGSLPNPSTEYSSCLLIEQTLLNTYIDLGNYLNESIAPVWDTVSVPSIISDTALSATSSLIPYAFTVSTARNLFNLFIEAHVDALNYIRKFSDYVNGVDGNTILSNMNTANSYIAGISNDNIITGGVEKHYARTMWDSLVTDTIALIDRATFLNISIPYTTQSTLVLLGQMFHNNPSWVYVNDPIPYHLLDTQLSVDLPINGIAYRQALKDTFAIIADLNIKIAEQATSLNGVSGSLLLQQITDGYEYALHLADDNLVTQSERKDLRKSWDILIGDYNTYSSEVSSINTNYGGTLQPLTSNFDAVTTALQALGDYLNKGIVWDTVSIPAYIDALSLADTRAFKVDPVNVTTYKNLLTTVFTNIKILDQSLITANITVSTASKYVSNLTNDGVLTSIEKKQLRGDWIALVDEGTKLIQRFKDLGLESTPPVSTDLDAMYISSFESLSTSLNNNTFWSISNVASVPWSIPALIDGAELSKDTILPHILN